jgi:hypothetical protein
VLHRRLPVRQRPHRRAATARRCEHRAVRAPPRATASEITVRARSGIGLDDAIGCKASHSLAPGNEQWESTMQVPPSNFRPSGSLCRRTSSTRRPASPRGESAPATTPSPRRRRTPSSGTGSSHTDLTRPLRRSPRRGRDCPGSSRRSVGAAVRAREVTGIGPVHARHSRRAPTVGVLGALVARRVARPPDEPLRLVDEAYGRAGAAEARWAVGVGSAGRGDTRRCRPALWRGAAVADLPGRAMVIPKAFVVRANVRAGPHAAIASHAAPVQSLRALCVAVARRSWLDRVPRLARALQLARGSNRTPRERYVRFLGHRTARGSLARGERQRDEQKDDSAREATAHEDQPYSHAMTPSTVTAVGSVLLVFLHA